MPEALPDTTPTGNFVSSQDLTEDLLLVRRIYNPLNYEAVHYSSYKSDIYSLLYNNTLLLAEISLLLFTHLDLKKPSFCVFSWTLFFSDCHTRFMPPIWPQRQTEISSCCHFVRLIFLSLSLALTACDSTEGDAHRVAHRLTFFVSQSLAHRKCHCQHPEKQTEGERWDWGGEEKQRMLSVDLWFCEKPALVFLSYQQRMDKDKISIVVKC